MFTRRHVLQMSAATAALAVVPRRAPAQPVPLRRSLHEIDLDDPVLVSLRDFVAQMRDPSRDGQPVSWVSFANIHGTTAGFNLCPHGNWYFLPWHRAYVQMYEAAVRDVTGNADFAMPYWDWTAHSDFPAAFGDESFDGQPNPLFVQGRLMATGDPIPANISGQAVLDSIMAQPTFEEFGSSRATGQDSTDPSWISTRGVSSQLESTPHDLIHCRIRGPFMCAGTSPQDPIFQMHHCNIDRLWDAWNRAGGANTTNTFWTDMAFTDHFIDPSGAQYGKVVNELLEVVPLGYTYVPEPAPPPQPTYEPGRELYLSILYGAPLALETGFVPTNVSAGSVTAAPGEPGSVSLETAALDMPTMDADARSALESAGITPRGAKVFLRRIMPEAPEGTELRVFVNTPDASADTPTEGNPNFVTSIGFFGVGPGGTMPMEGHAAMEGMEPSVQVDLPTEGLEPGAGTVTLQFVPVPLAEGDTAGPVTVTEVELAVI
jgi:tyrosinase